MLHQMNSTKLYNILKRIVPLTPHAHTHTHIYEVTCTLASSASQHTHTVKKPLEQCASFVSKQSHTNTQANNRIASRIECITSANVHRLGVMRTIGVHTSSMLPATQLAIRNRGIAANVAKLRTVSKFATPHNNCKVLTTISPLRRRANAEKPVFLLCISCARHRAKLVCIQC